MADFGVGFKITADTSQFQRELRESIEATKGVQRGLKDIGISIGSFLGVGAVVNGFLNAANAAQEMRDKAIEAGMAVSDSVASVARFGDGIDLLTKGVKEFGISALSVFTKFGEEGAAIFMRLFGTETEASMKIAEKIAEDSEKALKKIGAARARYSENVEAAEKSLAEARDRRAMKEAEDTEKLGMILAKQLVVEGQIAATKDGSLNNTKARVELEKLLSEEADVRASIAKDEAATQERINKQEEALRNEREKAYQKTRLNREDEIELTKLQLKGANFLNDEERARLAVLQLQTKQKMVQSEVEELLSRPAADRTQEENKRLGVLFKQGDELAKQIELKQGLIAATNAQAAAEDKVTEKLKQQTVIGAKFQTSKNFETASDEALAEKARRGRQEAADLRNPALGGGTFNNFFAGIVEANAKAAEDELRFRQNLRRDFNLGGEDYARRNFKGDPLAFDSVFQRYVTDSRAQQEISREQTDQLRDLNSRLAKVGFTK